MEYWGFECGLGELCPDYEAEEFVCEGESFLVVGVVGFGLVVECDGGGVGVVFALPFPDVAFEHSSHVGDELLLLWGGACCGDGWPVVGYADCAHEVSLLW